MKCRKYEDGKISWFKPDSYVDEQYAVVSSLKQRLSVLKGELWYQVSYGIPLLDKVKSKSVMDATVLNIVSSHPDVNSIEDFESSIVGHSYTCSMTVLSVYGIVNLQI